jgi:hypothetical protein
MEPKVNLDAAYVPSEDVVAREIEGELIIVPLTAGIGDMEDELFAMNEVGMAIWAKLASKKSLDVAVEELNAEFEAPAGKIEQDVIGFTTELLKRRMVVEAADG